MFGDWLDGEAALSIKFHPLELIVMNDLAEASSI